jgi:hypothetical protein
VVAAALLGVSSWASAGVINLGNASNFAVYGFGTGFTDQLGVGPITVNGNVGVGPGGDSSLEGNNVVITGRLYYSSTAIAGTNFSTSGGPWTINGSTQNSGTDATNLANWKANGSIVDNSAIASNAKTDLLNLYAAAKVLSATAGAPTGSLSSDFTWTGNGGTNVATLTSFNYSSGDVLTLNGSANDEFILNISGGWNMSGSAEIVLGPNVSADHVLFNVLQSADGGTGVDIGASGSSLGYGILMALDRNITFDTPGGEWNGRLFSDTTKTLHLFSDATVNQPTPPTSVPIPASLPAGLAGLAAIGIWRWRKTSKARE